jgi:hypothetical protein
MKTISLIVIIALSSSMLLASRSDSNVEQALRLEQRCRQDPASIRLASDEISIRR